MSEKRNILYEVVIKVAPAARDDYLSWLQPHMDEMLTFDGFQTANLLFNLEDENEITCCYRLRDKTAMNACLAGPAQKMRADGVKRFGDAISARRRILFFSASS